jgi:hypothetical protein
MDPSARPEGFRETDQVKEHGRHPSADAVPEGPRPSETTPPRNLVGPHAPDERALETFGDGAGI